MAAEHESRKSKIDVQNRCSENHTERSDHLPHHSGTTFAETAISSPPSPATCQDTTLSVTRDLDDIPVVDAIISTSTNQSLTTITTCAATLTTPATPADLSNKLSSFPMIMTQVGDVIPESSYPVSKLSCKHNRRYTRIHRLLPARIADCLVCNDRLSSCMLNEKHEDTYVNKLCHHGHSLPLTSAQDLTKVEVSDGELYASSSSNFLKHKCMLPQSCDLRPCNIDESKNEKRSGNTHMHDKDGKFSIPSNLAKCETTSPIFERGFTAWKINDEDQDVPSAYQSLPSASRLAHDNNMLSSQNSLHVAKSDAHRSLSESFLQPSRKRSSVPALKSVSGAGWSPRAPEHQQFGEDLLSSRAQTNTSPPTPLQYTTRSNTNNLRTAHGAHRPSTPLFPDKPSDIGLHPEHSLENSRLSHFSSKWFPRIHRYQQSTMRVPLHLSHSSDIPHTVHHDYENFSKSPHYHERSFTSTKLISPVSLGDGKSARRDEIRTDPALSNIQPSKSLPEDLISSTHTSATISPLSENISGTISSKSQPSRLNSSDTANKEFWQSGMFPLYDQRSTECDRESSSLCDICKKEITNPGADHLLLKTSDSSSQAYNISGMETSV